MGPPPKARSSRARRVARACDYCRQKRLKCTPNQQPCLNCQLYGVECTSYDRGGRPASGRSKGSGPAPEQEGNVDISCTRVGDEQADGSSVAACTQLQSIGMSETLFNPSTPSLPGRSEEVVRAASEDFDHQRCQFDMEPSPNFWEVGPLGSPLRIDGGGFIDLSTVGDEFFVLAPGEKPISSSYPSASQWSNPTHARNSVSGKVSGVELLKPTHRHQSALPGIFVRKGQAATTFLGFNSIGATLARCLKDALESQQLPLEAGSLGFLIDTSSHISQGIGSSSASLEFLSHELPSRDVMLRYYKAYLKNVNAFYPIIDETLFRARAEMFYTADRSQLGKADYSLLYLVISIGAASLEEASEYADGYGTMYQKASSMFHDFLLSVSESSLQVILLHIIYQLCYGRCGAAWTFCGLAIRTAQSLGLHRNSPTEIELSEHQLRLRSRLWWITLDIDSLISIAQGRPSGIAYHCSERDISVLQTGFDGNPNIQQTYSWRYKLSRIRNRFCNIMDSTNALDERVQALESTNQDLIAWSDSLPPTCRPKQPILVPDDLYPHILIIHLEYFNLMRSVHWAAITLAATQADSLNQIGMPLQASEALCADAARSYIRTMNENLRDSRVFIISFHNANCLAAIGILYRNIISHPSYPSAKPDLEYLKAAKAHLEQYIPNGFNDASSIAMIEHMLLICSLKLDT